LQSTRVRIKEGDCGESKIFVATVIAAQNKFINYLPHILQVEKKQ